MLRLNNLNTYFTRVLNIPPMKNFCVSLCIPLSFKMAPEGIIPTSKCLFFIMIIINLALSYEVPVSAKQRDEAFFI